MTNKKTDQSTTLQDLKDAFVQFRDERGWRTHHTPRNLAMSIVIEAAELLEHFQWGDYSVQDEQKIADELADVLTYCVSFADVMNIDVATAFYSKLEKTKQKYPTDIFKPGGDNIESYHRIKAEYRKGK